jgi:hypothetical protein
VSACFLAFLLANATFLTALGVLVAGTALETSLDLLLIVRFSFCLGAMSFLAGRISIDFLLKTASGAFGLRKEAALRFVLFSGQMGTKWRPYGCGEVANGQCCGSGMFNLDPGSFSFRIPDLELTRSQICIKNLSIFTQKKLILSSQK